MQIENGEWKLTPDELTRAFALAGGSSGPLSLIPIPGEDASTAPDPRIDLTEEQRTLFDLCLQVLGNPDQVLRMHYSLGDTRVSRSAMAESTQHPGTCVTLAQAGTNLRVSLRSPLELRMLVYDVLSVDNALLPTKLGCDLSTEAAATFLALLDQYRRSWMLSLLHHASPDVPLKLADVRERLQKAGMEDFRWSLNLTDKLLPIPVSDLKVAGDPGPALSELEEVGLVEALNGEKTLFEFTEAGEALAEGNKQAASRMVISRTTLSEEQEPLCDVFVLTRTPFDLFLILMSGGDASLSTLLPGDMEGMARLLFERN